MSIVEPGSEIQSGSNPPAVDPKKKKRNTYLLAGGGILVAALVFLYAKSKNKNAAGATAVPSNSTTPTLVLPSSNQDATQSSDYAALSGQIGQLSNLLSKQNEVQPPPTGGGGGGGTNPPVTTPTTPGTPTGSYVAVSPGAVAADIAAGQTLFQSGTEANAWDIAHGTPAGQTLTNPSAYYGLSAAAAQNLAASGNPVYVYNPNG
jgi:hypothetical protein